MPVHSQADKHAAFTLPASVQYDSLCTSHVTCRSAVDTTPSTLIKCMGVVVCHHLAFIQTASNLWCKAFSMGTMPPSSLMARLAVAKHTLWGHNSRHMRHPVVSYQTAFLQCLPRSQRSKTPASHYALDSLKFTRCDWPDMHGITVAIVYTRLMISLMYTVLQSQPHVEQRRPTLRSFNHATASPFHLCRRVLVQHPAVPLHHATLAQATPSM
jgi:hypothetical protein